MPTFWGSRTDRPQVGSNPTRAWVSAKRAFSDAIRMSQYAASASPGDGGAVDRADHRCAHGRPPGGDVGERRGAAEFLQVKARAEHRVGAGEYHDVDAFVGVGLGQRGIEPGAQGRRQRVPRLGTVQGQGAYAVGGVGQ